MNEIIYKFLDKNYRFTNSTYVNYVLFDKTDKIEVSISSVFKHIVKIFEISVDDLKPIFDSWADKKAIELSNRIIDYKYAYYQKYGVELDSAYEDLNLINESLNDEGLNSINPFLPYNE